MVTSLTLLSVSLLTIADWRAWTSASTSPSHSLNLWRASAPSELTFLKTQLCDQNCKFWLVTESFHKFLGYLRHPEVFLKTVVHSALIILDGSVESLLHPECGMMISSVSVWSPLLMTTIFSGSCEERFHRVPAGYRKQESRMKGCN